MAQKRSIKASVSSEQDSSMKREVIHVGTEEVVDEYANSFNLQRGPWDFALKFGVVERADDEVLQIRDKVVIRMSPQHTKTVAAILINNVLAYEQDYGTINVPGSENEEQEGKEP